MKTRLIIPPATPADWRWREYKGLTLVSGDCIDCEVIIGKAVAKSVFVASTDGLHGIIGKRRVSVSGVAA